MLRLDINLVWTILNLLIWYVLIRVFLFKPINKVISKREESISSQYAKAQELQKEAEAEKNRYTEVTAEVEKEKAAVFTEAKENARNEYDRIVTEADEKAAQIIEDSRKEAEQERTRIIEKAEQEIRSMIMEAVAKSMQSSQSDQTLYDQFLEKAGETDAE